jgi:hypothetical protein
MMLFPYLDMNADIDSASNPTNYEKKTIQAKKKSLKFVAHGAIP